MYLPMVAMMVGMGAMFAGNGSNKIVYVGGGAMALGMGGMMIGQMGRGSGDRKVKLNGLRRDYLRYLSQVRRKVRRIAAAQREALEWVSPAPLALTALLIDPELRRVWERRPSSDDFAKVRIGTGTHRLAVRLVPPETKPVEDLDPLCAGALRRFIRAHGTVPGLPVGIALRSFARVAPGGEPEVVYGMLRALIAQIAIFHSPDDVRISVCASRDRMPWWQWIKWLPHNMHPTEVDAAGPVRMMAPSLPQLEAMIGAELASRPAFTPGRSTTLPFHVVIVDDGEGILDSRLGTDGIEGAVIIDLNPASSTAPGSASAPALRLQRHRSRHRDADQGPDGGRAALGHRRPRRDVARRGRCVRQAARATAARRGRPRRRPAGGRHHADLAARHRQPAARSTSLCCGGHGCRAAGCACRSAATPTACRSSWTSRSRRRAAWGRTAWSSARPARASPSCSGRWSWAWP